MRPFYLVGLALSLIHILRIWSARGRKDDYGGMGSSGDPFAFDVAHGYEEMPESEKIDVYKRQGEDTERQRHAHFLRRVGFPSGRDRLHRLATAVKRKRPEQARPDRF